jgi:hypothetical protein
MVPQLEAAFALRTRRGVTVLATALVLTAIAGCGHRRSALRPMFLSPAPAPAAVVPSCPTTTEPALVEPPATPSVLEQAAPLPPAEVPAAMPAPAPEASGSGSTTPPRPSAAPGEPPLELNPANSGAPSGGSALRPDNTRNNGRRTASRRLRQASLQEALRPFVNDPDDLFTPPKADRPWKYVVLHHSAHPTGSYNEIDREHRKVLGWEGCGYHLVIGNGTGSPDGQIEVAKRWSDQKHGVHCRDGKTSEVNEYGIGICLVGDLDDAPPTPRQVEAAKALVAYLSQRYAIPAQRVATHAAVANSPTACPGKQFPAQAILGSRSYAQR